jgi:hypothetical protein
MIPAFSARPRSVSHSVMAIEGVAQLARYRIFVMALAAALSICIVGCSTPYPNGGSAALSTKRILFVEPGFDPTLELQIPFWSPPISANDVRAEKSRINDALSSRSPKIVDQFANTLVKDFQDRGYIVERVAHENWPVLRQAPANELLVRGGLTAGFVYKTLLSTDYVPFVQVVLEVYSADGRTFYHQLYVATDRPFNPFMKSLPANTTYSMDDINSLAAAPDDAIDALAVLADQLANKFAADILLK